LFVYFFFSFESRRNVELPETSFTRSISNPEAVMRRRRQQKLERKLQLFRSKDGGPDTGGTLKVFPVPVILDSVVVSYSRVIHSSASFLLSLFYD
jgi:hypothetical protein